jgi:hypothetical protein
MKAGVRLEKGAKNIKITTMRKLLILYTITDRRVYSIYVWN